MKSSLIKTYGGFTGLFFISPFLFQWILNNHANFYGAPILSTYISLVTILGVINLISFLIGYGIVNLFRSLK